DAVDDLDRSKGLSDVADRDRSHGLLPSRPFSDAPSEARPRALFAWLPNARAATARHDVGPVIGGDYRGNFNSPLLTNAPDPRWEILVSCAKTALASRVWRRGGEASPKSRAHSRQMERARAH